MNETKKILIAEDDDDICTVEQAYLEASGYKTTAVKNGNEVESRLKSERFDLLLLDVMLPEKNGYEICRKIRNETDIQILMVTAKTEPVDKIRGLSLGADDYIAKPFDPAELVARVSANLRQYEKLKSKEDKNSIEEITAGYLRILTNSWRVFKGDKEIKLANREFEILKLLAQNPDIVFSKERIFEAIWGEGYAGDIATVMVHINRIREKIEEDCKNPRIIETVWGAGYRFNTGNV